MIVTLWLARAYLTTPAMYSDSSIDLVYSYFKTKEEALAEIELARKYKHGDEKLESYDFMSSVTEVRAYKEGELYYLISKHPIENLGSYFAKKESEIKESTNNQLFMNKHEKDKHEIHLGDPENPDAE